jgi:hypothetical protein
MKLTKRHTIVVSVASLLIFLPTNAIDLFSADRNRLSGPVHTVRYKITFFVKSSDGFSEERFFGDDDEVSEYDRSGKLIARTRSGVGCGMGDDDKRDFLVNGDTTEEVASTLAGVVKWRAIHLFDAGGNVIRSTYYDREGNYMYATIYSYEFDGQRNWLKRSWWLNERDDPFWVPVFVEYRKIAYYTAASGRRR